MKLRCDNRHGENGDDPGGHGGSSVMPMLDDCIYLDIDPDLREMKLTAVLPA